MVGWSTLALALDQLGPREPAASRVDAIVVAGCRVDPGGVPSDCLKGRTDRAIALYQAGVAPLMVFTGGVGENPPSEATVAAQRARAAGVPDSAIRLEDRSTSTEENARFAAELGSLNHVVVVSDAWHTHRVARVFGRYFPTVDTVGVNSPWSYRIYGAHREVLAVAWYAVNGRL
jgi:uncharacterized SAM-binding protein YcdF (DUF218 family)